MDRREFLERAIGTIALGCFNLDSYPQQRSSPFSDLEAKFREIIWIDYSPTNYNPEIGRWPSQDNIKKDLDILLGKNIKGIITYGANDGLKSIPQLAKQKGIQGVVMGIWDLDRNTSNGQKEWVNAVAAKDSVDGYCAGNEGLLRHDYSFSDVQNYVDALRLATGKPVTTSETWSYYFVSQDVWGFDSLGLGDWIFPNVHPYFADIKDATQAVNWTIKRYNRFVQEANGRFIMFKEGGFPTEGDPEVSQDLQRDYYDLLQNANLRFSFFEAFDQYWKKGDTEPYWGLWDKNRSPKKVVDIIRPVLKNAVINWEDYS